MSGEFDQLGAVGGVEFSKLTLEKLRVMAGTRISRRVLEDAEIATAMEMALDQMIVQLRTFILGHKLVDKRVSLIVDYPATAWDHVKESVCPKLGRWGEWYLRRHPVRMHSEVRSVDFSEFATFPESTIAYPPDLGPVHFMQTLYVDEEAREPRTPIWPTDKAMLDALIEGLGAQHDWSGWTFHLIDRIEDPDVARELFKRIEEARRRGRA